MTQVYLGHPECIIAIVDVRAARGRAALDRQCAALPRHCEIEDLIEGRVALIIHPGWVAAEPTA